MRTGRRNTPGAHLRRDHCPPVGGGLGQIDCEGWAACCEPPVGGGAGQTVCDEADVADGGAGHTVCDGWDCADGGDGQSVCAGPACRSAAGLGFLFSPTLISVRGRSGARASLGLGLGFALGLGLSPVFPPPRPAG